jgi:large subunit ribosomal protein L2
MAVRYIKTRSNGRRTSVVIDYNSVLTAKKPLKSLTSSLATNAGRNMHGCITVRHKGGRVKRRYREIDFHRNITDIEATVKTIEYDPNRTAFISLVSYANGVKKYILTPANLKVGDKIISADKTDIKVGNCMKISNIFEGTFIHNIELFPGRGGQLVRSAGTSAQVLGKDETGKYTVITLSSGEVRKIPNDCKATIGSVSNEDHILVNVAKAGVNRYRGIRPTVRGSAMNPVDHPHGGGEGCSPVGHDAPRTP